MPDSTRSGPSPAKKRKRIGNGDVYLVDEALTLEGWLRAQEADVEPVQFVARERSAAVGE